MDLFINVYYLKLKMIVFAIDFSGANLTIYNDIFIVINLQF